MSAVQSAVRTFLFAVLASGAMPAAAQVVNNCLPTDYVDRRGTSPVTITASTQPGTFRYSPRCVLIDAGTTVRYSLNFAAHPTIGGRVSSGTGTPDPDSPIGAITSGTEEDVLFTEPRIYGYYCDFHVAQAMMGAIEVPFVAGFE